MIMENFWMVIDFILCAIDIALYHLYCFKMLDSKECYKRYHYLIFGTIATIAIFIVTSISPYSLWKTMFSMIMLLAYSLKFFSGVLKQKLLYTLLFCTLVIITEVVAVGFVTLVKGVVTWDYLLLPGVSRLTTACASKTVFILLFTVILNLKSAEEIFLPLRQWLAIISSFSLMLMLAISLLTFGHVINASSFHSVFIVAFALSLLCIYFLMYYFFYSICNYFKEVTEMNLLNVHNEYIEKYLLQKEESDKMIKVLSHDLKHNLAHWKQLAEDKKYIDTLKSISQYEQAFEQSKLIDVNNDTANAIMNQKLLFATQNNIEVNIRGAFDEDILISKMDLCSLLGNLLDNAIEANMLVMNNSERKISMLIRKDGKFLFIILENSYKLKPIIKNNVFVTQKNNRLTHGIGMISIQNIVNKYEGSMNTTHHENIFKTSIMLQVYDKKVKSPFHP